MKNVKKPKKMKKQEIKAAIEEGKILCKVSFQVQGRPKKHVEESQNLYLNNLKKEKDLVFIDETIESAEKIDEENNIWSCFSEVDILFPNLEKITWVSTNFMPASIEVIKPVDFKLQARQIQNWLNDVISKLHEIDLVAKQLNSQNKMIANNLSIIVKNYILTLISNNISDPEKISKITGIPKDQIEKYLEFMEKEGTLKKEKEGYKIESKKQS